MEASGWKCNDYARCVQGYKWIKLRFYKYEKVEFIILPQSQKSNDFIFQQCIYVS